MAYTDDKLWMFLMNSRIRHFLSIWWILIDFLLFLIPTHPLHKILCQTNLHFSTDSKNDRRLCSNIWHHWCWWCEWVQEYHQNVHYQVAHWFGVEKIVSNVPKCGIFEYNLLMKLETFNKTRVFYLSFNPNANNFPSSKMFFK